MNLIDMEKKYTEKDLVSFGKHLLSKEREGSLKQSPSDVPYKDRFREIYDADIANWEELNKIFCKNYKRVLSEKEL